MGYSSWGHKESDTTEYTHVGCIYKVTPPGKPKSELRGKKPHPTDGKTEAKGKKLNTHN